MMLKDTIEIIIDPKAMKSVKEVANKLFAKLVREKTKFDVEEIQLLIVWLDSCLTPQEQDVIRKRVEAENKPKKIGLFQYDMKVGLKTYRPSGHTLGDIEYEAMALAEIENKTVFVWDSFINDIASVISPKGTIIRL